MKIKIQNKSLKAVGLILVLLTASCQKNPYPGIPDGSIIQDEAYGITLFLHVDDSTCRPRKASVWSYNHDTKEAKRIVSSTGGNVAVWCKSDTIKSLWPKDSIESIYSAQIISWPDKPLRIVVNGCPDRRNVWSYIIAENSDSAILLPTNAGFLGHAYEENLLVCLSYAYYEQGGRYNVIKIFDTQGNLLNEIPINQKVNKPEIFYEVASLIF